jgi:CheY-like chemotaxis protein
VLVGVAEELAHELRAEAVLHTFTCTALHPDACSAEALRALGACVVMSQGEWVARVAGAALTAGAALLALDAPGSVADPADGVALSSREPVGELLAAAERLASRAAWAGATVLVLDDDPAVLDLVRAVVEGEGVEVRTLADPSAIHAALALGTPNLLLVDLDLGAESGIEITRTLRAEPADAVMPIVLFSARSDPAVRQAAYDAGADEFLPEPIVIDALRARVSDRLARQRLQRLTDGLHPGTCLPLPARAAREAAAQLDAARLRGERSGGAQLPTLPPDRRHRAPRRLRRARGVRLPPAHPLLPAARLLQVPPWRGEVGAHEARGLHGPAHAVARRRGAGRALVGARGRPPRRVGRGE